MCSIKNFLLSALSLMGAVTIQSETLRISTQREFRELGARIGAAVNGGAKVVDVVLEGDTFFFGDNHVQLANKRWGDVSISLRGNGAVITRRSYQRSPLNKGGVSDLMTETDRLIEVVDEESKLCRIHIGEDKEGSEVRKLKNSGNVLVIRITQWYKSETYRVEKMEDGWIYFTAPDLGYNKNLKCYSVNADYGYSHKNTPGHEVMPRFRMEDSSIVDGGSKKGDSRFLSINGCSFGSLEISGLRFEGSRGGDDYLIYINKSSADSMVISGCSFTGLLCHGVQVLGSNNVRIRNNSFRDCYRYCVFASYSENTVITGNSFTNVGLACFNNFAVRCSGSNYYVAHNEFCDFGCTAIALGTWWRAEKRSEETGIVEHNHIYFTPAYMANWRRHSVMDTGAVYIYTQNDGVDVRYNFIHDYNGACENRGIFCDDGASHFSIYGNVVINTPNGFSIDSWRAASVEKSEQSKVHTVNVDNNIYDNVVDGALRFEGRAEASDYGGCSLGRTIVLTKPSEGAPKHVLNNLKKSRIPTNAIYSGMEGGQVIVPAATQRRINALDEGKHVIQLFKTR